MKKLKDSNKVRIQKIQKDASNLLKNKISALKVKHQNAIKTLSDGYNNEMKILKEKGDGDEPQEFMETKI